MSFSNEMARFRPLWTTPGSPDWESQKHLADEFEKFVAEHRNAFDRACVPGHLTGSVLIVTEDFQSVLLTHHRKLNLWLQLGGHADGDEDLARVALREGEEESGLTDLRLLTPTFDLDKHWIPERKGEPGHYHYDVRYVASTASPEKIVVSDESHALRWWGIDEAYATSEQWSMHRQFDKVKFLRERVKWSDVPLSTSTLAHSLDDRL